MDFLHKITINDDPAYLHIDFELKHTEFFPRRIHVYHGMLSELKKPTPIISVPIYLKPRKKAIPKTYQVEVGGYLFHEFSYKAILLWEHADDIRSGKLYPLAPLLLLFDKEPSRETLVQQRDIIIKHEANPARRRTLFVTTILTALAQKMFDSDFLWSFFKEQEMQLADDPVLNRWFNERYGDKLAKAVAEAEAKAEAEAEAKAEAKAREAEAKAREREAALREALHEAQAQRREVEAEALQRDAELFLAISQYLAERFSTIPTQLLLDLQRLPSKQYSQAINWALSASDLDAFSQKLADVLASQTN